MIISQSNFEKAVKEIKSSKGLIVIQAQDDEFNRRILEYGKFNILLSPEKYATRDSLKQEDSGLNHVLAKIAAKNKISIGINLEEIASLEKKEKAKRLARVRQNLKLCRKAKTPLAVLGEKTSAFSLLLSLGASTLQIREAIYF